MADLSQIELNGTTYNIKDTTARGMIPTAVGEWLDDNITQQSGYVIDKSLKTENAAADAKAAGDRLECIENLDLVEITDYTTQSGAIYATNGSLVSSTTGRLATSYINVSQFQYIYYSYIKFAATSSNIGMAFYDVNKTYQSGFFSDLNSSVTEYDTELKCLNVPETAVYARFTLGGNPATFGEFKLYGSTTFNQQFKQASEATMSEITNSFFNVKRYGKIQSNVSNQKLIWIYKNRFGSIGRNADGSTYYNLLLTGDTFKNLGTSSNLNTITEQLTENDFMPFYMTNRHQLIVNISVKYKLLRSDSEAVSGHNSGNIYISTRNPITGNITSSFLTGSFVPHEIETHGDYRISISAILPEIYENQNIAIIYQIRYPEITESWTINLEKQIFFAQDAERGSLEKAIAYQEGSFIATKNYNINDIFIIGNQLFIATANITSGQNIVVGTNANYTNLGQLITNILNS